MTVLAILAAAAFAAEPLLIFEHRPKGTDAADLYAQKVAREPEARWAGGAMAMPVARTPFAERRASAVPDGAGGAIVVYEATISEGRHKGDVDLFAQRIGPDGRRLWGVGRDVVRLAIHGKRERYPALVPDGEGGAFLAYELHSEEQWKGNNYTPGEEDVFVQRITPNGDAAWGRAGEEGLLGPKTSRLGRSAGETAVRDHEPAAVPDGQGGLIAAWSVTSKEKQRTLVNGQRFDRAGNALWQAHAEGKKSLYLWEKIHVMQAAPVVTGSDRFLLAESVLLPPWSVSVTAHSFATTWVWKESRYVDNGKADQWDPAIVSVGGGSAVVVYKSGVATLSRAKLHSRGAATLDPAQLGGRGKRCEEGLGAGGAVELLAQMVFSNGGMSWKGPDGKPAGVVLGAAVDDGCPLRAASIGERELAVAFETPGGGLRAQRINAWGAPLPWGKEGVPVYQGPGAARNPSLAADGEGGLFVAFELHHVGALAGDVDIHVQRLGADGKRLWGDAGRPIAHTDGLDLRPLLVAGASR